MAIETTPKEAFAEIQTRILLEQPPWLQQIKQFMAGLEESSDTSVLWNSDGIHIMICDWKWYSSFPEVKAFEDMFDWFEEIYEADEGTPKLPYRVDGIFLRIGEDLDDIQTQVINKGYDLAEIGRTFYTNFNY